jgi:hypothetical protein
VLVPLLVSKEPYYRSKRALLLDQKRPEGALTFEDSGVGPVARGVLAREMGLQVSFASIVRLFCFYNMALSTFNISDMACSHAR